MECISICAYQPLRLDESEWDAWIAKNPALAGTPAAAISGGDIVAFIRREKRKCKAEAAFEAHLNVEFERERRSYFDLAHDADSKWWRNTLGDQWYRKYSSQKQERALCCPCGRVCHCAIGCVLDANEERLAIQCDCHCPVSADVSMSE